MVLGGPPTHEVKELDLEVLSWRGYSLNLASVALWVTQLHIFVPSTRCTCVIIIISFLICHTGQVDGLSWQKRNAPYLGCKHICAQNLREIRFVRMENVWICFFQLMKHGTNTLHVASYIFVQCIYLDLLYTKVLTEHFIK